MGPSHTGVSPRARAFTAASVSGEICAQHGEKELDKQESLARLLHQLGVVLHFVDDPRLRDTAVLSPHWVTDAVYRLLRFKESPESDGVLTLEDAMQALPRETVLTTRYLLRLMERFEICFPLDEQEDRAATRWLVPGALCEFQPEGLNAADFEGDDMVRMRYVYDPLPEGVIPRLIVLTHLLSEGRARWRHGVVLGSNQAQALVRRDRNLNHLEVIAFGTPVERLNLLEIIQGHLDRINADVPDPRPYAELELAGLPGTFRPLTDLEAAEEARQPLPVTTARGSKTVVEPTAQLNQASEEAARDPQRQPLPLFLSYSDKDRRPKDRFLENLAAMSTKRLITTWHDNLMEPGIQWREEIKARLDSMSIFIGLLTNAFMTSEFVQQVEMTAASKRLKKEGKGFLLVLILVDDIPLQGFDFPDHYQILKPGGKAVRSHRSLKAGFNQAQRELETLILNRQKELRRWRDEPGVWPV